MKPSFSLIFCVILFSCSVSQAQPDSAPVRRPGADDAKVPTPATPPSGPLSKATLDKIAKMTPIFDGKSLNGWIQVPPYATSVSGDDISNTNLLSLAKKLSAKSDPVSAFLQSRFDQQLIKDLADYSANSTNTRALKSALVKNLSQVLSGPSIYEEARFRQIKLRSTTAELRKKNPAGQELARLNRLLLEDAYPAEIASSPEGAWTVKDGAMASLGAGRGVIHTREEFGNYRLIFTMRHLGGPPNDHRACVLIYGTTVAEGQKGLDALGAIQFQPPNGGSWDYRPGKNNNGKGLFTRVLNPKFDEHQWFQVELLVHTNGTARMAVAQPVGTKAVEVLVFNDPTAGKKGPIAWQMHNKGLFDEFKDVRIEVDPTEAELITVR